MSELKYLGILFGILILVMAGASWLTKYQGGGLPITLEEAKKRPEVIIGAARVEVEVADTPEKRQEGLSGREKLDEGKGLLFVFDENSRPGFWMKDMKFAIDILWINDGKTVKIDEQVPPPAAGVSDEQLKIYPAPGEIDYVLEVPGGYSQKQGIGVGDEVRLENF